MNTKGGGITVPLTSCLTGLDKSFLQIKKIVSCHTAETKPVKQEVNGTVILPPLVFPGVVIKMINLCFILLDNYVSIIELVCKRSSQLSYEGTEARKAGVTGKPDGRI